MTKTKLKRPASVSRKVWCKASKRDRAFMVWHELCHELARDINAAVMANALKSNEQIDAEIEARLCEPEFHEHIIFMGTTDDD